MLRALLTPVIHQTGYCACGAPIDVNRQTKCGRCEKPVYTRR